MRFNKIMILILAIYTLAHIYTSLRNKIELGKTKLRIKPKYMNITIIMFIFLGFFWILSGYHDYQSYLQKNRLSDLEDILSAIAMIDVSILTIINQYKMGQIRRKGVNTLFRKYKWEELEGYYYYYYNSEIILCTNKKSLFFKKNKEIKWRVEECQVNNIKKILDKHINET